MRIWRQQGLTLLELLLTVVIFSLVITVFSQAMFQIGLFERASARSAGGWQRQWAAGFALDDYFHALVLAPEAQQPPASGGARSFSAWWVEQAGDAAGRPVPVALSIRRQKATQGAGWDLFVAAQGGAEVMLAHWEREVSFQFINSSGEASDVWPPLSSDPGVVSYEALPRAVQVLEKDRRVVVHQWVFDGLTQPGLARSSTSVPFGRGATQ